MTEEVDGLSFVFDDSWTSVKWDETDAYRKGIGRVQHTKAVDLVGRRPDLFVLIEVKDFRRDIRRDWLRVKDGSLADEVAGKVRDTLAGLVGLHRRYPEKGWEAWGKALHFSPSLRVILWLERPADYVTDPRRKDELQHFKDILKRKLSWLTPDVFVCSQNESSRIPGVSARDAV